jgi:hypothetical protein
MYTFGDSLRITMALFSGVLRQFPEIPLNDGSQTTFLWGEFSPNDVSPNDVSPNEILGLT